MEAVLGILYDILLVLFLLVSLIVIPFGLPGTFLIVLAAALYGLVTGFLDISWTTILFLLGGAIVAEGAEAAAGIVGAKKYGSGGLGIVASMGGGIVGAVLGVPFFFGLGAIPGALAGAFAAAVAVERISGRPTKEAFRAGWGAFVGRLAGTGLKGAMAVAMAVVCLHRIL